MRQRCTTTPDRFTVDNYNECKVKNHRSLKKLHPDKRAWTFPAITTGKAAVIDEIARVILQALELFELRANNGKKGLVRAPWTVEGFKYFEMPEDRQIMGVLKVISADKEVRISEDSPRQHSRKS